MDQNIQKDSNIKMDKKEFYKMKFIMNALQEGWSVKKSNDVYIFKMKHNNRKEIYKEEYLEDFINRNISLKYVKNN